MAATFSELYTRIEREVLKQTNTAYLTDVKAAIVSAIRYYEQRPVWFTETVGANLSLTAATDSVSLPADFGSMICLRLVVNSQFRDAETGFEPVEDMRALRAMTGATQRTDTPSYWCLFNNKVYVDTLGDSTYTLKIDYHKKDASYPSGANDTSIWFEEAQDLIRYMAMSLFYGDRLHDSENEAKYFQKAEAVYDVLRTRSNLRQKRWRLA